MVIKGNAMSGKRIHKMVFIETKEDWENCEIWGKTTADYLDSLGSIGLKFGTNDANSRVTIRTHTIDAGFPFRRLILSWNCSKPDTFTTIYYKIRVSPDNEVWYRFGYSIVGVIDPERLSELYPYPYNTEITGIGKIDIDNLSLSKPMRYAIIEIEAFTSSDESEIMLRRLSLSFSADNSSSEDYAKFQNQERVRAIEKIKLAVPYFSQRNLPSSLAGNCCSPTSVSMVLNYYGKTIDPETCAHAVYDSAHQIFGNWPFNVEGAYLLGMGKTWVEVHSGFDEIYDEVASGKPVIISIAYGYNKLPNSPVHEETEGHLIVVVGFDGPNIVICNDPAGHGVEDGIVRYPRKELESIWVSHGGVAYHLWPE